MVGCSVDAPAEPPYVYAGNDSRPRSSREIELCEKASTFDWQYTATYALAVVGSVYLDIAPLKGAPHPAERLIGPGLVGLSWGGFLSGGYLSLPKCDPLWAGGDPPEGNIRSQWPIALMIGFAAGVTSPFMDYVFLGSVKPIWEVSERAARIFVAGGAGVLGAIVPWILPPRTWAARQEIDKIRVSGSPAGASFSYTVQF